MPSNNDSQTKPKRRGLKIALTVVGVIVGLIVLAVLIILLYAALRPASAGDYRSAYNEINNIDGAPLEFAGAMSASLADPTTANNRQNLENRYANTVSQVGTVTGYVDDASSKLAFKKDKEAGKAYEDLQKVATEFKQYVEDYEPLFVPIGDYWRACIAAQSGAETCDKLYGELEAAMKSGGGNAEQRALGQAILDQNGAAFESAASRVSTSLKDKFQTLQTSIRDLADLLKSKADKN